MRQAAVQRPRQYRVPLLIARHSDVIFMISASVCTGRACWACCAGWVGCCCSAGACWAASAGAAAEGTAWYQGCCCICCSVMRSAGSRSKMRRMMSKHSGEMGRSGAAHTAQKRCAASRKQVRRQQQQQKEGILISSM